MKTKQTIYKTAGGCYRVGKQYFQYLDGALREATKEECMLGQEDQDTDIYRVDREDFVEAVLEGQRRHAKEDTQMFRVDTDDLNAVLAAYLRRR